MPTTHTTITQNTGTAYREAGHAVASWCLGIMLKRLTLQESKSRNAWNDPLRNVDFEWIRENRSAMVERLASVLVAGPVAQTAMSDEAPDESAAARVADAHTLLDAHSDADTATLGDLSERWVAFFEQDAARAAVNALVQRLTDKGELGGKAATRIIESHLKSDT